jgi:hypothetical protein
MGNVVCVEKPEEIGEAFVFGEAEQVSCAANAERRQFRQLCGGPEFDAELGQTLEQVGVANAHAVPDAPPKEE